MDVGHRRILVEDLLLILDLLKELGWLLKDKLFNVARELDKQSVGRQVLLRVEKLDEDGGSVNIQSFLNVLEGQSVRNWLIV